MKYSTAARLALVFGAIIEVAGAEPWHPVGIIISVQGDAHVLNETTSYASHAQPGMLVYSGDTLFTSQGSIRVAFCGDHKIGMLTPNRTARVGESGITPPLENPEPISSCDLPQSVVRDPTLPVMGFAPTNSNCPTSGADLLETLRRAALDSVDDTASAILEYESISCHYPAAKLWVRSTISQLHLLERREQRLPEMPGETYALLIGVSQYPEDIGSLRFADADAKAFDAFLRTRRGGSVPDDHLNLLTNETASFDSIHSALARLLSNTEKDHSADTLIIFIAGHGGLVSAGNGSKSPPKAYFLPSNVGSRQDIGTSALEVSNFRSLIAQSALAFRRVIVYLDICFAGYFAFSPEALIELIQAKGGTPGLPNPNNPQLALLMAAAPLTNEPDAWESPTFGGGHGAFTISVLEGLNGQVRTSTRALTAEVLNEWVESETRRLTVAVTKQTPSLSATSGGVQVLADTTIKSEQSLGRIEPMSKQAKRSRTHNEYLYRQAKLTKPSETEGMPAVPGEDAAFTALVAKDPLSVANSFSRDQATQQIPEAIRQRRAGQLRVALKDRGQAVVVRYLRGEQSALAKSDFAQCAAYFRAAMDLEPVDLFDESRMLFCEGRAAIYDKDYTGAVTLLEQSIQLDPERAYAYNALGIAYLEQVPKAPSYFDLAESALKDAIRLAPGWAYPLHNLALAYSERGDFLGASATYQRAMKLAPYYSYLPYNLGLLNQNVNRLGEAERCYRLAIDAVENAAKIGMGLTARDRAVAWNALATVEMARKSYKRADEDLDKALHDDPALAEAKHNRAILLTRKGNTTSPEAERLWRQAIAEDPLAIVERVALADYLERQGRLADAESECREVLRIDANNVDGNRLLAQIYMLEARASDALSLLERVRESLPGDPRVCEEFGDVAAAMKRIGEAVVAYQTAERLFSTSSDRKRVRQKLALISKGPTK